MSAPFICALLTPRGAPAAFSAVGRGWFFVLKASLLRRKLAGDHVAAATAVTPEVCVIHLLAPLHQSALLEPRHYAARSANDRPPISPLPPPLHENTASVRLAWTRCVCVCVPTGAQEEVHRQEGVVHLSRGAPVPAGQGQRGGGGGVRVRAHPVGGERNDLCSSPSVVLSSLTSVWCFSLLGN